MEKEFIDKVNEFSNGRLKRQTDLEEIYSLVEVEELQEIAFTAKYISGLYKVMQKGSTMPEVKNLDQIKTDFIKNINKLIEQLKDVLTGTENYDHFNTTYFSMNQDSLANLLELINDLDITKMYLNRNL